MHNQKEFHCEETKNTEKERVVQGHNLDSVDSLGFGASANIQSIANG